MAPQQPSPEPRNAQAIFMRIAMLRGYLKHWPRRHPFTLTKPEQDELDRLEFMRARLGRHHRRQAMRRLRRQKGLTNGRK